MTYFEWIRKYQLCCCDNNNTIHYRPLSMLSYRRGTNRYNCLITPLAPSSESLQHGQRWLCNRNNHNTSSWKVIQLIWVNYKYWNNSCIIREIRVDKLSGLEVWQWNLPWTVQIQGRAKHRSLTPSPFLLDLTGSQAWRQWLPPSCVAAFVYRRTRLPCCDW